MTHNGKGTSLWTDIYDIFNRPLSSRRVYIINFQQSHLPWLTTMHASCKYADSFCPPGTHHCWVGRSSVK